MSIFAAVCLTTMFIFWVLFFIVIESFPAVLNQVSLAGIHYYALKQRYVTDPKLVFVYRHTGYVAHMSFTGDLYWYGITPEPIPYVATYDRHGFRMNSAGPPYEIAVIGDSYIEIGETDEVTFAEFLRREAGRSVMNLGRAWYGPHQYLEVFKRYAVPARPRYAILCFFAGNDFNDIVEYEQWRGGGRYYFYPRGISARFAMATQEVSSFLARKIRSPFRQKTRNPVAPDPYTFGVIEVGGRKVAMAFAYWEQAVSDHQRATLRAILSEFRALAQAHRIIPVLVYVPTATQVHAAHYSKESFPSFIERVKGLKGNPSLEALANIADELGIKLINLLPVFRVQAERGHLLYYPFDTHWNAEGRRTAAAFVASVLR